MRRGDRRASLLRGGRQSGALPRLPGLALVLFLPLLALSAVGAAVPAVFAGWLTECCCCDEGDTAPSSSVDLAEAGCPCCPVICEGTSDASRPPESDGVRVDAPSMVFFGGGVRIVHLSRPRPRPARPASRGPPPALLLIGTVVILS